MRIVPVTFAILSVMLLSASGCGSGSAQSPAAASVGVQVEPPSVLIAPSGTVAFRATVTGIAVTDVNWTVDCGSITNAGVYTAPPSGSVCHVTASSVVTSTVSGTAWVNVATGGNTGASGWAAKCAAEPLRSTGTIYYACDCQSGADANCVAGDDANPGTNPAAPLRSLSAAAAKFRAMKAGDTVALCRGGRFSASGDQWGDWINQSCTASSTCDLRDYSPTAWTPTDSTRRPEIVGPAGARVFALGGKPNLVDGLRFINLVVMSAGAGSTGIGFGKNVSDLEVCNVKFDGLAVGVEGALDDCVLAAGEGTRRNFRGNQFVNNTNQGALYDGIDSDWDGNYFDNNAYGASGICVGGATGHSWYMSGGCPGVNHNVRFINNEVHRNAMKFGHTNGSPVKFDGSSDFGVIENNYIDNGAYDPTGCPQQAITAANTYGANGRGHRNLTVRRNLVIGGQFTVIDLDEVRDVLVEDNVVVLNGSGDTNGTPAIGVGIGNSADGDQSTGTVRNNTVHATNVSATSSRPLIAAAKASSAAGWVVTGNSVTVVGETGGAFAASCYEVDPAKITFMDNNHCYGAPTRFARIWGTGEWSLAGWRTYTAGLGAQFDSKSLDTDPMFANAPTDLTPLAGSPLIGAASTASTCTVLGVLGQPCTSPIADSTPTWSPLDAGKTRSTPPSIGAFDR